LIKLTRWPFWRTAERGVVVQDGRIVELVAAGRELRAPAVKTFDADSARGAARLATRITISIRR
jgi:hypothetical protein